MEGQYLVEFDHVSFRYQADQPYVLRNIQFNVKKGDWVSIVGHNGSGKSTLAKLLTGIEQTFEGDIRINGQSIKGVERPAFQHRIGMVFQNPENQFVGSTVRFDVAFGLENQALSYDTMHEIVPAVLKDVDMYDKQHHEPAALSGGQKQRVAIAGVLALEPQLIILDEATAMLDPEGRRDILTLVKKLNQTQGVTVIAITHDLSEVVSSDRIIVMNQGEILLNGTAETVFKQGAQLLDIGLDLPFEMRMAQKLNFGHSYMTYEGLLERLT
ncbi:energy-coupling factor transporter ATPase [Staphylococcus lutrae]|uniref:Energy-coupling factor transporter ATPase n=1 Tax=Staphylococcus lutrae TaxID=155085 RepID=A0AAC9RN16_9STAP|nr:energy-coupling factor transporter ATPase [Staphylococcus lutrae]ARJ50378.1 energy-coupling factor transporter ATPase [Staphylococcus lutrae]PNZ38724.1 energy-coupling factor transporter ATPase [Staphylococcus lutrae]